MLDLSVIQMMIDEGPDFLAEYAVVRSRLADQVLLLDEGADLSASEIAMLRTWIQSNEDWISENSEKYQKLQGFASFTEEQLQALKKECEELCQIQSEQQL